MAMPEHGSELITEGCKSYHKALYAVAQFCSQVQRIIWDGVDCCADDLAAALGLELKEMECTGYANPTQLKDSIDGLKAEVGLKCEDNSAWKLYYYLWVGEGNRPYFGAEINLTTPSVALAKLANGGGEGIESDEKYVLAFEYLPEDGSVDLPGICDRVIRRWIELWASAGGLQQFLPRPKKKKPAAQ